MSTEKTLYFPASFAAKDEHVIKFWLTGCKKKFWNRAFRKIMWKIHSWGIPFLTFCFFLILKDDNLYVITEDPAASLDHEVVLRKEATRYKDGGDRWKKSWILSDDCDSARLSAPDFFKMKEKVLNLV